MPSHKSLYVTEEILAKVPIAIWTADLEGVITHVEGGLHVAVGQNPSELEGVSVFKLAEIKKRPEMVDWFKRSVAGEDFTVTMTVDGRVLEVRCGPYRDGDKTVGAVAYATDVTECRMTQEEHEMLASLVKSSYDAVIGKTLEGTIVSWNPAAEKLYGFTQAEAIGKNISDLIIPPERKEEFMQIMANVRKGEFTEPVVTERLHKSGRRMYVSITVSPLRNARGEVNGASVVARDVTDEWWIEREKESVIFITTVFQRGGRVEDNLREIPPMLSSRFKLPLVAIELFDLDNKELSLVASQGIASRGMTKPTREPLSMSTCGEAVAKSGEAMLETGKVTQLHFNAPAPVTIEVNTCVCVPIMVAGKPFGAITMAHKRPMYIDPSFQEVMRVVAGVIGQEVSRSRSEAALRASELRFHTIVDNTTDIIMLASPTGVVLFASQAVQRILGYTPEEFVAKSGYDYIHPDDIGESQRIHAKLLATDEIQQTSIRMRRKTGEYVPVELRLRSIHDASGTTTQIVVVARELSPLNSIGVT